MKIVPIERQHFASWKELRAAVYTELDDSFHDREMEWIFSSQDKRSFLLLSSDGAAAGLLELSLRNIVDGCVGGPVGYIEGIYLRPEFREQGWGRRLMEFAEQWCRNQGCRHLAMDAEVENHQAQQFYLHAGFQEGWRIVEFRKSLG